MLSPVGQHHEQEDLRDGGIGSGDTSEGIWGQLCAIEQRVLRVVRPTAGICSFQYNMLLNYHDAKYANAYEDTLYNAVLGDTNLAGTLFAYTNPLVVSEARTGVACLPLLRGRNIPRTLLQLPNVVVCHGANDIYVNLFIGGTMTIHKFMAWMWRWCRRPTIRGTARSRSP